MPNALQNQTVSRFVKQWDEYNSPQRLTLLRPFAPQQPTNPNTLLPPGQVFNRDRLELNVSSQTRMAPIQLLQIQSSASSINRAIDAATGTKNTFNNHVELLVDGEEAFGKMKEYIRSAQKAVFVEMFLFHSDKTGWEFAQELVAKKKQGVDVKVLLDAMGQVNESGEVVKFLQANGVDVKLYNKKLFDWENVNITHRKLVIVDGYKGITGGMNVGDEYQFDWHDLMASVEGETVQEFQQEFFQNWQHAGGQVPANLPRIPAGMKFGSTATRVTVTSPQEPGKEKDSKNAFISAIQSALHHIYVVQPYFSDPDILDALIAAARRGVEVRVLLPGVSDNPIHEVLNQQNAERLVKAGGKAFKVDPGPDKKVFTHAKLMTIDGIWTTIGSTNFDTRALENNQELNISVTDATFTKTVEDRLFEHNRHALAPYDSSSFSTWQRVKAKVFSFFDEVL
jgi:cardiolipin synthase A/B